MPAKSKAQQSAFGMALAARRGDIPPESLKGAAALLYRDKSLSRDDLKEYASTKKKRLPGHVGRKRHATFKRG